MRKMRRCIQESADLDSEESLLILVDRLTFDAYKHSVSNAAVDF